MLLGAAAWFAGTATAAGALAEAARRHERRRLRRTVGSALAHDLRTPLAQIQLFSDLLRRDAAGADARSRQRLAVIDREVRRLSDRVGALLLLAGSGPGTTMMVPRPVQLAPLLVELAGRAARDAAPRGVALETDIADVYGEADPQAIRLAVAALLDAAIEEAAPGATIRLGLREREAAAVITVATTPGDRRDAPGREGRRRLHSPPVRGSGDTPRRRSAWWRPAPPSLALEIARIVAHGHGGSATRARGAGAGVCYTLTLPGPATP